MTELRRHELVVHLFAAADGPAVDACYGYLRATWRRCVEELGLTSVLRAYAGEPPPRCPPVDKGDALLAARGRPGPGVAEVVVRRVHDVVCLSLVVAPGDGTSWPGLLASWRRIRGEPPRGLLGSVVIALATSADDGDGLDVASLTPQVLAGLPLEGRSLRRGTLRAEPPIGPFAVWEAVGDADDEQAVDLRAHRDLVAVAPAGRMPQLSAWTWSRGGGDRTLPPLARYLLHAAKLRYLGRVWAAADVDRLRARVEAAIDAPDGPPDELRGGEARLARSAEKLAQLRTTVRFAVRNLAAHARGDRAGGLFADDDVVGRWFEEQLAGDLEYVGETLAAARRVLAARGAASPDSGAPDSGAPDSRVTDSGAPGLPAELVAALLAHPGDDMLAALRAGGLAPLVTALDGSGEDPEQVVDVVAGFRGVIQYATGLLRAAARVCMVEIVSGGTLVSAGTGFLVADDLVLTNHHVLTRVIDGSVPPTAVTCTFDHHVQADGSTSRGAVFGPAADWLVASSPRAPGSLDYALVRLDGSPGAMATTPGPLRGWVPLPAGSPPVVVGTPLLIMQHPLRRPMQIAMDGRVVGVDTDGTRLTHAVNTERGSSGSPCFTHDLELVALHHARAGREEPKRNRAVPVAAIAAELRPHGLAPPPGG